MSEKARRRVVDWVVFIGMALLAAVVAVLLIMLQLQTARVDALESGYKMEQDAARDRGYELVAPDPDDLMDDPDQGDKDKGDDEAASKTDVEKLVKEAVSDYLSGVDFDDDNAITEADIVATVSNYLAKHGIEAFDDDKLAGIVGDEVTRQLQAKGDLTGSQGEKGDPGEKGEKGDPGPAPTPEEIGAAVKSYIEANGLPMCPTGYEAQTKEVLTTTGAVDSIICVKT